MRGSTGETIRASDVIGYPCLQQLGNIRSRINQHRVGDTGHEWRNIDSQVHCYYPN